MADEVPLTFLEKLNQSQTDQATKVAEKAIAMGLNPRLAVSIAYAESRLNPAIDDSEQGAIGMMQVRPNTGKMLGFSEKDLRNPDKNLEAGLMYLKQGYDKVQDPALTAAGYHAGYDHKFFEDPEKYKLGPKTMQYVQDINSYGGFSEPPEKTIEAPKQTQVSEPASEEGYLSGKLKDLLFKLEDTKLEDVAESGSKAAGTVVGAYAAPKIAGALESLQQAANARPTGGELWAQNWAGQNRLGVSVPEAAAGYQRSKGQGKVSGRVSQMYGPRPPVEPGVFQPGRLSLAKPPNPPPITPLAGKVADYGRAILNSPLGQRAMGALGGYGAVTQGMEAYQQAQKGDMPSAVISGLGAVGNALTAIPTFPTRAIGAGLSTLTPAAQWMLEHSRKMSPEAAQGALQRTDPMGNPIP